MLKLLLSLSVFGISASAAGCVAVEGSHILAKDAAKADPAFAAVNPELMFSYAPVVGKQRVIQNSELSTWATQNGIRLTTRDAACFERKSHELTPGEIEKAVREVFVHYPNVQVNVLEVCKCLVPAGQIVLEQNRFSSPPAGHPEIPVLWSGKVVTEDRSSFEIWARVRTVASTTAIRVTRTIRDHEVIYADELEEIQVTDSPLRLLPAGTKEAYIGKVANRTVPAWAFLDRSIIAPLPEITRGSTVVVDVINGGTHLTLKARAETSAKTGETVTLTNPSGLRRFSAVATGRGTAELIL